MHHVWDIFGNIIAEMNGSTGAALRETVYLEGMPLSAIDAAAAPKKIYAIHTDHLHRPVLMTDAAKSTVWQATWEPYGRIFSITGSATQNLGLPGQWFQLETGLHYNWHRHYDPSLGRFLSPDPLGFVDGPAMYAYAGGQPHLKTDRRGLMLKAASNFGRFTGSCLLNDSLVYKIGNKGNNTPIIGEPNSGVWLAPDRYRYFGSDGKAEFDVDLRPHRPGTGIEIHPWINGVRQPGQATAD